MEPTKLPQRIDEPPLFMFWRIDDLAPIMVLGAIGIIFEHMIACMLVGAIAVRFTKRDRGSLHQTLSGGQTRRLPDALVLLDGLHQGPSNEPQHGQFIRQDVDQLMELQKYLKSWKGLNRENTFHRIVLTILATVLVLQQFQLMNENAAVVLEPPVDLQESAEITQSGASDSYLRGWALFIAQFLGNVTPKNADIVKEGVLPLLGPKVYTSVRESLEQQVIEFRESGMSTSFSIEQIIYEDSTGKYFVVGKQVTRAPAAEPQKTRRVYEVKLKIDNYRPVVTHLSAYSGRPRLEGSNAANQEG